MKRPELWRYFNPVRRKHVTTRFVLSEADAAVQYPDGATKVKGSLEASLLSPGVTNGTPQRHDHYEKRIDHAPMMGDHSDARIHNLG